MPEPAGGLGFGHALVLLKMADKVVEDHRTEADPALVNGARTALANAIVCIRELNISFGRNGVGHAEQCDHGSNDGEAPPPAKPTGKDD